MEQLNFYIEDLRIRDLLQKLKEKYCSEEKLINQNKSLYSLTNLHVSSFIKLPIKNRSCETLKDITIVFDGWTSLPNNINDIPNKYMFNNANVMMRDKKSTIQERINYFESLNLNSINSEKQSKKLVHSGPLVVDEKFRDLDYVLSIEKYKNKYIEERKQRFRLRNQIKKMLRNKEGDNCLKPSEIIKEMSEVAEDELESVNTKYLM